MRKDEVLFYAKVLLNNKISPARRIRIITDRLFKYSTNKQLSDEFKLAKAIEWYRELHSLLFMPPFDIDEILICETSITINLREYDYDLINEVADRINNWYLAYQDKYKVWSKYDEIFKEYASLNHPSHNKKGNWKHKEISEAQSRQNQIKLENPKLFDRLLKSCNRFNTSVDLVIEVASKYFYLSPTKDDGMFQFNLKNNDVLQVFQEYYEKTNIDPYKNEYDKISLVRSILNDLAFMCFFKDFEMCKDGYYRMKHHSRILVDMNSDRHYFQSSKSLYNHYITFNDFINNLLRKPFINHFHYILNDININKVNIIKQQKPPNYDSYNSS